MSSPDPRRVGLERWLRAFCPADAREEGYRAQMLTLLERATDPFSRAHFEPGHFTASAFVLSPERDALLLILHGKLHRWLQPGGHIEPDDADLVESARREVVEETGLAALEPACEGIVDVDIHAIPALRGDPPHAHFDVRFAFVAADRNARAASDARATRWVPLAEVTEVESDSSVMRAVDKLTAMLNAGRSS